MNKKLLIGLGVLVLLAVAAGAAWALGVFQASDEPTETATTTVSFPVEPEVPEEEPAKTLLDSDASGIPWKVGDAVGSLTVVSVERMSDAFELGGYNVQVTFEGSHKISGVVEESEMFGQLLRVTDGSLPCGTDPARSNSNCGTVIIGNADQVGLDEVSVDESIEIEAVVARYVYRSYPSEGGSVVTLTSVVRK